MQNEGTGTMGNYNLPPYAVSPDGNLTLKVYWEGILQVYLRTRGKTLDRYDYLDTPELSTQHMGHKV